MSTSTETRPTPMDRQVSTKQRRSGNPAKRSGAIEEPTCDPARSMRAIGKFVLGVAAIAVLTSVYTFGVMFLPWSVDSLVLVAMLAVPALLTMAFVPESRAKGRYRWPVAWALGFTSLHPMLMLILAQTWVLSRFWLVEYTPRSPIRLRRQVKTSKKAA